MDSTTRSEQPRVGDADNTTTTAASGEGDAGGATKLTNVKKKKKKTTNRGRRRRKKKKMPPSLHHHQQNPPRSPPSSNHHHRNNNNNPQQQSTGLSASGQPGRTSAVITKKELLRSKCGWLERGSAQPACSATRMLLKQEQLNIAQRHNPDCGQAPRKKRGSNVPNTKNAAERLKEHDGEKVYAGARFSEPPSPSILPKPPSHWVRKNQSPKLKSRELSSNHLKSLLQVESQA
ncbi:proline-rich nuclear receptor coactivator 2-like [Hippocampus comes]|uniref:proline-rich nuclear receptor coactivator 2-like n=1 Tax=Hippocampus comes TaxID=109280 RepID=UPI00094EC303|nr:PREDICTED: proline-rich nuclear receptor coactivator 2-like [Hippocampus comes]